MKELSIEEKAKRYDEIIEKANKMHSENCEACQMCIEELIPELKESEDERIIQFLIHEVKETSDEIMSYRGMNKEAVLAWLEKHNEKPQRIVSAEAKEAMYDKPAPVRTGAIGFDGKSMESKPCEQKPAETEKGVKGNFREIPFSEQKPAWSEEDKNRINRLIAYFEDKESFTAEDDVVYANWLKSIKDKYTWKPSDWQMEALKEACDEHWEPDGLDPLYTLWEQLKKLREK